MESHNIDSERNPRFPSQRYENVTTSGHALAHFGNNIGSTVNYYNRDARGNVLSEGEIWDIKRAAILAHLMHPDIEARSESIQNVKDSSYLWVFRDGGLQSWLQRNERVFWVTGKAGAGKSTLIKFISRHDTTMKLLRVWAGSRHLILVHYYFWYTSTNALSRSYEGLIRSVLYTVLCSLPNEIASVFPHRWASTRVGRVMQPQHPWKESELTSAMQKLATMPNTCFAFFVDGLDECTPSTEHEGLLENLEALMTGVNMKLCVSSRPWRIFERHFNRISQRLDISQHTHKDMSTYIMTKLREAEDVANLHRIFRDHDEKATSLVSGIVDKAEGVWLWTTLVTKTLRQELELGRDVDRLQVYVDELPRDLKAYFKTMIYERIDYRNHSAVATLLKCAALLAEAERTRKRKSDCMSFLNFYCLQNSQDAEDQDFAPAAGYCEIGLDTLHRVLQQTRLYLGSLARDMLYIPKEAEEQQCTEGHVPLRMRGYCCWLKIAECEVQFSHRTVLDYLLDSDMQSLLDQHVPSHFQRTDIIARITLARLRLYPKGFKPTMAGSGEALYLWKAIAGVSQDGSIRRNAIDPDNNVGCLKTSGRLWSQYDVVALRYLATGTHDWQGRLLRGRLCRFFVSCGFTKFLEGCTLCLAKEHGVERSSLMQQAISALFSQPDAPSHMSIICMIVRDEALWRASENAVQRCPTWWHYLLYRWWMLKMKEKPHALSREMLMTLEAHIFAIAETLCLRKVDIFQDPPWSTTANRALVKVLQKPVTSPKVGPKVHATGPESLFVKLLGDAEKARTLYMTLWPHTPNRNTHAILCL